jgi:peptide-methionine (S)-S-oxide reductase
MKHYINGLNLLEDYIQDNNKILFGAGCFWGVERKFWDIPGVNITTVGYAGGDTDNPSYEDVCYKNTNHAEVVEVVYDVNKISLIELLKVFWECHDPTQGMRQGNDKGTQYRSVIYCSSNEDLEISLKSKIQYQETLQANGYGDITTEISLSPKYFLAEEYHQQYLAKNPNGYCGLGGTNCSFPND